MAPWLLKLRKCRRPIKQHPNTTHQGFVFAKGKNKLNVPKLEIFGIKKKKKVLMIPLLMERWAKLSSVQFGVQVEDKMSLNGFYQSP